MDPVWILLAFALGFGARLIALPPLVGFLAAGFVLNAVGVENSETIEKVADVGVWLLLFSIGLKLDLRSLVRPEIWGGALLHMTITVIVIGGVLLGLGALGLSVFADLDLGRAALVAFALSFSSTVFAVKVIEERGESNALHARVAIGILIMQDLVAVVFLTLSEGKLPSPWALALFALPLLRPLLIRVLKRCGHGELLVLAGILLTFGGAALFKGVGLKPDLGALVAGVIVSGHVKSKELANILLGIKELLLVGFFLSIGLAESPTLEAAALAVLILVLVPFKTALFYVLLTRFTLKARTSLLSAFSLANYSEFGLIVGGVAYKSGWISGTWMVVIAIALALTFVIAAPLNALANAIYARLAPFLIRMETARRHPEERPLEITGEPQIVICGMGRLGTGTYEEMTRRFGDRVLGLDFDARTVERHREQRRNVALADVTNPEAWLPENRSDGVRLVLLATGHHATNLEAAREIARTDYEVKIAAITAFPDEAEELRQLGVDAAFDFFAEAGTGFADHVCDELGDVVNAARPRRPP